MSTKIHKMIFFRYKSYFFFDNDASTYRDFILWQSHLKIKVKAMMLP